MQSPRHTLALTNGHALPTPPISRRLRTGLTARPAEGTVRHRGLRWESSRIQGDPSPTRFPGRRERQASRWWQRVIRPGWTVCDLRIDSEYYTMLAARAVGPHGHVLAVASHPDQRSLLQRHAALNGLEARIEVHVAERKTGTFPEWFGGAGLGELQLVRVDGRTTDDNVWSGSAETFRIHQPMVLFTRLPEEGAPSTVDWRERMGHLQTWGYRFFRLVAGRLIMEPVPVDGHRGGNWVAIPADAGERFD